MDYLKSLNNTEDNKEVGFDTLNADIKTIEKPTLKNMRKDIYYINSNPTLVHNIIKKVNLTNKDVVQINNTGYGNCYFKAISQFYTNNEKFHIFYRKSLCEYIASIIDNEKIQYPYIYGNNNTWLSFMDNFYNIIYTGGYVGEYEIIKTTHLLSCNIVIYKLDEKIQPIH